MSHHALWQWIDNGPQGLSDKTSSQWLSVTVGSVMGAGTRPFLDPRGLGLKFVARWAVGLRLFSWCWWLLPSLRSLEGLKSEIRGFLMPQSYEIRVVPDH